MSPDDRTPDPSLPRVTEPERAALAVLDRRGRTAAASLGLPDDRAHVPALAVVAQVH